MNGWQRIKGVLSGLVMTALGILMIFNTKVGINLVVAIACLYLFFSGIKSLAFYFTMARYMVGGRRSLFTGVIMFDLGIFMMTLDDLPILYIIIYLVIIHAFSGAVDVLNALESRKLETSAWIGKFIYGAVNISMACLCIYFGIFRKSVDAVVYIYAAGLVYSGVYRTANAFRKTSMVYIQ